MDVMGMTEQVDLAILRRVAAVSARINQGDGLVDTLQAVADGVVGALGFGAAAVNYVRPDGDLTVLAVAGPSEARDALAGKVVPRAVMDRLLARSEGWGSLRFVSHQLIGDADLLTWVPPTVVADGPDAWHPEDALLAVLRAGNGVMVGVLSVDLPPGLRQPSGQLRELLEIFAIQAGLAIDKARTAEDLHAEHVRLRASEAAFRFSFATSAGAMAMVSLRSDDLGRFLEVNDAFSRTIGYRPEELVRLRWFDLIVPAQRAASEATLAGFASGRNSFARSERQMVRRDHRRLWVGLTSTVIAPGSGVSSFLLIHIEDITERRAHEMKLARHAQTDALTGLANRRLLLKYLTGVLANAGGGGPSGVVIYTDLDRFKRINDRHGHAVGDLVLQEAATRLRAEVRTSDVVARPGGDEFVIVAADLDPSEADELAQRIRTVFSQPFTAVAETVTISTGIASFDSTADAETVLHRADLAMYANKPHPD